MSDIGRRGFLGALLGAGPAAALPKADNPEPKPPFQSVMRVSAGAEVVFQDCTFTGLEAIEVVSDD